MSLDTAKEVIRKEAEAVAALIDKLDDNFIDAVDAIMKTTGRVIVTGIGKSGIIGRKIAATFSSTGTPALFLHPVEAVHGDLGIVTPQDIVLAISKSGDTSELAQLIPLFKRLELKIILLTGYLKSSMAERADFVIDCSVSSEASSNNLIPTASSTAAMVMGDALALTLLHRRGFSSEDFAQLHPGGTLGRRLLLRVSDLMHTGQRIPIVSQAATIKETLLTMSQGRLGVAVVVDNDGRLGGIFTDGDLRRLSEQGENFLDLPIVKAMNPKPRTIKSDAILDEVLALCEKHQITVLVIIDSNQRPSGIIHLHDVLKSKLI